MLFFTLAVLSSALVSILMRASEKHAKNNITMLSFNYMMCSLLGLMFLPQGAAIFGNSLSLGLGAVNGVLYLASFVLLNVNIAKNGVVLPSTFMKLGAMVPTILAVLLWGESPSMVQLIGIAMAASAIVLIRMEKGAGKAQSSLGLLMLLLITGLAESMAKVYEVYGDAAWKDQFLLFTFAMALVLCVGLTIVKKQSLTWMDALFGLLIGIPNYLSSRFLLLSLSQIPAMIAYPCFSVATIVLVTLAGVCFFKEKLTKKQMFSIGIILGALALLNL